MGKDDPAARTVSLRPPSTDLQCDETFAMIRRWLVECTEQHGEECHFNLPPVRKLPSHLINVCPPGKSLDTVNLERLATSTADLKYAALSYTWGPSQRGITTTQNYGSYIQGIKTSLLARAIQDAIWVTRKLGLQYLWVDSLCIIQDSDSDKLPELGKMDSIYSFSTLR